MPEPAQKCEYNATFNHNYANNSLLHLKWPILAVLAWGDLDFPDFPQKKFYNIDYRYLHRKTAF